MQPRERGLHRVIMDPAPRGRATFPQRFVQSALAIALASLISGCGSAPPPSKFRQIPGGARVEHDVDPVDVIPADLDLVVRLDLGRMRAALGPTAADALSRRALQGAAESELAEAFACAEVVWIATRAAELESGDRVTVIEGNTCMPELSKSRWEKVRSGNARVAIFDRKGEAPRAGTARIMNLGNHATVFVSPVELDSVKRIWDTGPDDRRGNPRAEGVVSIDLRPRPLPPGLAKRYPSIAAILGGIERVRGSAVLVDDGLKVDAQIIGITSQGADKAARFLEGIRDSLKGGKFGDAVKDAKIEAVEKTVGVKVVIPAKMLLSAM
ncbi:hypothetical protein A7982_12693 [Minicystis rosea]|nr:hypothetical protein A7982_12693 [Minicystis rosea]